VKRSGNAQEFSDAAAETTKASTIASADAPPCAICGERVAKAEWWAPSCRGQMDAHPRWPKDAVLHVGCGGCFKCGAKSSLELDAIGGIYCVSHMKQRIAAAGGPVRASDKAALQATEVHFVREAIRPFLLALS